jgi:hypothetical protein
MNKRLLLTVAGVFVVWGCAMAAALFYERSGPSLMHRANAIYNLRRQMEEDRTGDWNSTKGTNRPTYQITDPQVLSLIEALSQ